MPALQVSREAVAAPTLQLVRILCSDDGGRRSLIRRRYVRTIRAAHRSIYIASAYFVPDRGMTKALIAAAQRGVDVRLLLPSREKNDIRLVQLASQHSYRRLLAAGVRIYWWQRSHMHAKTAVIDGVWSVVGSFNLDFVSLFRNLEVVVEVLGHSFGTEMTEMFEGDFARAHELNVTAWSSRPMWEKLAESVTYRVRRLL